MDRYIEGSSMTYARNPQYWDKTLINGKEYSIPFADKVVLAVIPDVSTRIAAIRSGRLDWSNNINQTNKTSLSRTNPDLRFVQFTARPFVVTMNMQSPVLNKLQVREALTMAVDRESIQKRVWGAEGYTMDAFPQLQDVVDVHTPFEQLPAAIKDVNTYNPVKAKQLLAQAGYANGFSLKMVLRSGFPDRIDAATALAEYLAAVGVKLNIEVMESTAYAARLWGSGKAGSLDVKPDALYDMIIDQNLPNNSAVDAIYGAFTPSGYNFSNYYDEDFMTKFRTATATVDAEKRNDILRELSLKGYAAATVINLGAPSDYSVWQPWIRNYNGEATMGTFNQGGIWARMWIDESAKKR
jgi:peptide/nickel transport system substrate-binding protein